MEMLKLCVVVGHLQICLIRLFSAMEKKIVKFSYDRVWMFKEFVKKQKSCETLILELKMLE